MQPSTTSNTSATKTMAERLGELQYAAMAHELSGLPVPPELQTEFQELEARFREGNAGVGAGISTQHSATVGDTEELKGLVLEIECLTRELGEMQYAAMANTLSGLPNDQDFAHGYAKLEEELAQAKKGYVEGLRVRLNQMQATAMALGLAGQDTPPEFAREFSELEEQLKKEED
jgi:hypothetical protein